ncbi:Ig-like domain-containing protein [Aphanizomenon flos-aquae]|uniref:Ig-like domain-containing protein n=1 Tax=Aphanizomenon flos-aquae TaxID=1176 RepID=UPI00177A7874|nr:cadherin-like domain-containing protein [Aphanizomenon flos-aquae]MBD2557075.1 cadherin-like domain-containing protein [Aphanizomenon flos-aquae FACHB-1290]
MANNFNWVNATTLNGTLWDNGTLSSVTPITQIGTLTIGGSNYQYLNAQLNNTGTIVENHSYNFSNSSYYSLYFQNGSILNNSGTYEFQQGLIDNYSSSSVGTFNNSGTFKKTTAYTATIDVAFNNTGIVNVEAGTLTLSGGGVSNGGTFNLTSGQTLQIDNSVYTFSNGTKINGSGNLLVSGGTLQADGNWTLPTISTWNGGWLVSSNIITNSGTLTIGGSNYQYLNAQLNNTGTIVENHSYNFSNSSYYSLYFQNGAILNNSGIYELQQGLINNSKGTLNNSGTFKKTTANTATIGVAFNNTGIVEANLGSLNFSNTYTQNNANLVLKGGTVTFSNALTINGGSIEGNGSINVSLGVTNSGLLNPRYASNTEFGRLTINSNYTETNSARINIQLGGSTAATNFDQVDINGTATFDGTLNVSLLNSFTPTIGSTFDVLTYDSLSLLSNLDFTGLDINSTLQFLPQWFNDKLTLKVVDKSTITNINVTTNQDVVNASDGVLSLREAVIEANQNSLDNTIILGAQTYALNFSGNSDDNLAATGDLDILPRGGRLKIQGQGANQTFITATNLANLFQIHAGATINFSNVTIINSLLNDTVSVSKNVPLNLNVLNNDKSLKSQSIWLDDFQTTSVKGGTITRDNNGTPTDLSDDRLIYNPVAEFTGQDSFTYNITDGLVKEQATVTLNVANDAPPAINERLNTPINTAITFAILTNNRDYNGDIINFESFQNSSTFGGIITKLNNQLTYTPKADFSGPDTFSYKVNDGFLTTQSTVTVLVNAPPNAVITTTQDTINYTDGLLSLREAIIQANSANIDSKITLGEGTYALAINGANEDLAATGDLDIKLQGKTLTIQGQGKNKTILDANSLDRFFQIHSGATVILSGVTINKGLASYGGALANNGTLTILDSDFVNNQSIGAKGANGANGANGKNGQSVVAETFTFFTDATAGENGKNGEKGGDGKGGGIYNSGTLTISNSLIENNKVTGGQGGIGGNGGQGGVMKYNYYYQTWNEYEPNGINGSKGSNGNAYAGAIYNENTGSILINGGQFVNNLATPITGGTADNGDVNGIYNNGGTVTINSTVIESAGNTKLVKDTANKYFAQLGTNTPISIKTGGQQIYQDIYGSGWQTLAAETVNGDNQVLWKNVPGNYLTIWHLDNNWNVVSSEGNWGLNSPEAFTQETNFGIDANGDGKIGNPYTAIESAGNTKLVKDTANKYFAQVGTATPTAIKNGGQQLYQDIYIGWQTIAAETVNGDNQLLWKNIPGNYLTIWHLDNNWNGISYEGQWGLNSAEALTQETNFGIDTNGDGVIGNPYTPIESAGNTKLVKDANNKYFAQVGTNNPIAIKAGGQQIYQDIYAGWQTLAAETVNGDNQVLWKNVSGNFLHIWHLDSNWNWVSAEGNWGLNSAEALTQETKFGIDTNGDGKIGYAIIELAGNTTFLKDAANKYFTQVGTATPIAIKAGGQQIYQDIYAGWQTLAAETVNGDNQVLWKNVSGNFLHIWHLDSNWNWVSAEGNWGLNSAEALTQETKFGVDANGDGKIGSPSSLTLTGTSGNDILIGGANSDTFNGGLGNDTLYLGLNDNAVDNVNYILGDATDTVYQFVRGVGGDKLNFTGIANFDVITSGTSTLVRVGDGIAANTGFGTGQLLVTLSETSGFTSTNANINLFGGNFLFN